MIKEYKFAVMILYFDCENLILRAIENCAPFTKKIYILYSEFPYSKYNSEARVNFKNTANKELLIKSKHYDKIELIEGIWESEEEQRNECLQKAREDGFDYLIIQDADEFYLAEDYKKNIDTIVNNPNYKLFQVPWILFWKSTGYVLQYRKHQNSRDTIITTCPLYAVNLKTNVKFKSRRILNEMDHGLLLEGICFHLSWVLNDTEVYRKLFTWSHSNQIKSARWYRWKWLAWRPNVKNLGAIKPREIKKAIPFESKLPIEIADYRVTPQDYKPLDAIEIFKMYFFEIADLIEEIVGNIYRLIKKIIE